jgi:hypothetical protein
VLVAFLSLLEARRRNEHLLSANFGVSEAALVGLPMLPALVAEIAVWVMMRS